MSVVEASKTQAGAVGSPWTVDPDGMDSIATVDPANPTANAQMYCRLRAIVTWPGNPRKRFDQAHIESLADSIRERGVQSPIGVRWLAGANPNGGEPRFQVVYGECRLRAARLAGLERIPAIYLGDLSDIDALMRAFDENYRRKSITPIEEARTYVRMLEEQPGMTQQQLAEQLKISQSDISNARRLLRLPEAVINRVDLGEMTKSQAIAICGMLGEDPAEFSKLISLYDEHRWSTHQIEAYVKRHKDDRAAAEAQAADDASNPQLFDVESSEQPEPTDPASGIQTAQSSQTTGMVGGVAVEVDIIPPGDAKKQGFADSDTAGSAHWPLPQTSATPEATPETTSETAAVLTPTSVESVPEAAASTAQATTQTTAPATSKATKTASVAAVTSTPMAEPVVQVVREMPAAREGFKWLEVRCAHDDALFEDLDLTVDEALAEIREWRLSDRSKKLIKALRDYVVGRFPNMADKPTPLIIEGILGMYAISLGIDVETVEGLPL